MARGDWEYPAATHGTGNLYAGFRWRYDNTEEEAKASNRDLIRVEPYTYKTGSATSPSQLTAWKNMNFCWTYGGSTTKIWFERRVWFGNGSTNTKYYFSPTKTYDWQGGKSYTDSTIQIAVPYPEDEKDGHRGKYQKSNNTGSFATNDLTLFSDTGNCGYVISCPHNEDGTPKSTLTIYIEDRGDSTGGRGLGSSGSPGWSLKPSTTITLSNILRGTKVWIKTNSGWQKTANIHVKGEASGAQHYIYRKNRVATASDNGWDKYYG